MRTIVCQITGLCQACRACLRPALEIDSISCIARLERLRMNGKNLTIAAFAALSVATAYAQQGAPASGEWRVNGGDTGSTRYSPLDQINAANVKNLQVVWRWKAQNMGPAP